VLEGTILLSTGVPVVGGYKQGGREGLASKSLVKWLKMLWENWSVCVWCVVCCLLSCVLSPVAGEFTFLL
jgi:hypothetical protein